MKKSVLGLALCLLFIIPLGTSLLLSLKGVGDAEAWLALFAHPQIWPATVLSIFTGLISSVISMLLAFLIVARNKLSKISAITGGMIALPHLAFAIGISFLIMPSGIFARCAAAVLGWGLPPQWVTTHDPFGFSLIAVLVLKETPFLVWVIANFLNREDVRNSFGGQRAAALSLGHGMCSIWLRVFVPQILPRILWPIFVTFIYAATVVDVALAIGPTQPPTLAVMVWADLNDALVFNASRGGVGAVFLCCSVGLVALLLWLSVRVFFKQRQWLSWGPVATNIMRPWSTIAKIIMRMSDYGMKFLVIIYTVVFATLILISLSLSWPFPHLWPAEFGIKAWRVAFAQPTPMFTSLLLAMVSACCALLLIIFWFESQLAKSDWLLLYLSALVLGVPSLLFGLGQYRAALLFHLSGTGLGLFMAHFMPVFSYMFIVLVGPYRSFDPRWRSSSSGLMVGHLRFLWTVKLQLLKAPILAALAIGFAVSFVQYVPAQLISAGRFSTLPMEAVTLTSGSNRPLTAAFALLLMLPPLIVFFLASYFSKDKWARS
jgi:putative thiamine transport system permease protein